MFRKVLLVIFFVLFVSQAGFTSEKIVLAYVDFPPYGYQEEGEAKGIMVDIVKAVFREAGIELELRNESFFRAYYMVKNGAVDGIFNFYKTEGRLKHFDYSNPILVNPLLVFTRRDKSYNIEKIDDMNGLRVGTMFGYSYGAQFDRNTEIVRDEAQSHVINFKKLVQGSIDLYFCDKFVGKSIISANNLSEIIQMHPKALVVMDGHIGFTKDRHGLVIEKINKVISEKYPKKAVEDIVEKYYGSAD